MPIFYVSLGAWPKWGKHWTCASSKDNLNNFNPNYNLRVKDSRVYRPSTFCR